MHREKKVRHNLLHIYGGVYADCFYVFTKCGCILKNTLCKAQKKRDRLLDSPVLRFAYFTLTFAE